MSTAARIDALRASVAYTILGGSTCEFATVTTDGVPLSTPMLYSVELGGTTVDVSIGVSYPGKAERARRNPKVGLLIEAPDGGPAVSISALRVIGAGRPWDTLRQAYWYWARIFIHCVPVTIR